MNAAISWLLHRTRRDLLHLIASDKCQQRDRKRSQSVPRTALPRKSTMTNVLDGKIAVITGATSGIGLAIAHRFGAEGAQQFITGRRQEALDAAVAEITRRRYRCPSRRH